jgi:tetratricopeptide (TPR) repeat protein
MENGLVQQIQIGKVPCLVMSEMNHIVYLILFVFSSFYLEASQIVNNPTSSIEKLDLRSSNDSMRKYKEINPQKSLQFGFQALNSSIEDKISLDLVNTHYYIGESFYYIGDLKSSFEYLSKSLDLYYILDPSDRRNRKVVKPPWVLVIMGNVYYENQKYDAAQEIYLEAIENFNLFDVDYESERLFGLNTAQNNLALIELEQKNYKSSEDLYQEVYQRRLKYGDFSEVLSSNLYLLNLYFLSDNKELAIKNFNIIKLEFENFKNRNSNDFELLKRQYSLANLYYGEYLKKQNDLNESLVFFEQAKELVNSPNDPDLINDLDLINIQIAETLILLDKENQAKKLILESLEKQSLFSKERLTFYALLEQIYTKQNNYVELVKVKDSIIFYNSQPLQRQVEQEFNVLENLLLISEKQNDLNISRSRISRIIEISFFALSVLIIIVLSLKFNFDLQKEKNTRLKLEKDKINEELKLNRRELFSKVNFISQRNDYLNNIRDNLNGDLSNLQNLKNIKREIKNITTSEKAYEEFDKMFSQVYPKFYKRLNKVAKLSQTDIRLASYIKMNHTNNEISRISGISMRSVESQRYRLSKKLNLDKGQDLNNYILEI